MLSKEISDRLSVSIHTVNKHRQNIMQKMNADIKCNKRNRFNFRIDRFFCMSKRC